MEYDFLFDLPYGQHERHRLDLAIPRGLSGACGLVLMIHGGGWIWNGKNLYESTIRDLAQKGVLAASINHRYTDENVSAANILDDITSSLETITKVLSSYHVFPDKLLLAGMSSGGHLSLLYAYSRMDESPIPPVAVISQCAPVNLYEGPAFSDFVLNNDMGDEDFILTLLSHLSGEPLTRDNYQTAEAGEALATISPLHYVSEHTVPTLFSHGSLDSCVPFVNAQELDRALAKAKVPHDFFIYPNSGHKLKDDPAVDVAFEEERKKYIARYLGYSDFY